MNKYRSAVIGLGQIGLGYDFSCTNNSIVITHSAAFNAHPKFDLVAGVDSDIEKCKLFEKKFNKKSYNSIDDLFENESLDVVAISAPTANLYHIFNKIAGYNLKLIICEKPFSGVMNLANKMIKTAEEKNFHIVVNYIRRFNKSTVELKSKIESGVIGVIQSSVAWYSGTLLNNGSHLIDLLIYFFGPAVNVEIISDSLYSSPNNSAPDFVLIFPNIRVIILSAGNTEYSFVELDIIGSTGRVKYTNRSIHYYTSKIDSVFQNVNSLDLVQKKMTNLQRYQFDVLESVSDSLSNNTVPASGGESALLTIEICNKIESLILDA